MQKRTDKFLDKIVKKDYNNELEKILEKKTFDENTKSMLVSILYKIEAAYKDYEKVKPDVESQEEFMQSIIDSIKNNCEEIKVVKLNSKEGAILGNRTFLVEKEKKRIICYPIERKLLYCLAKINKKENLVKDNYYVINKTLTDLLNVGNNINTVEPMRDFNGYSWTTIPREIESIYHNLIYQNIRILVGNQFLNHWIKNTEYIIDYFESFQNKLEEKYGEEKQQQIVTQISKLSALLAVKYNPTLKTELQKEKEELNRKINKMRNNETFIQEITQEKRKLTKEIKNMDETLNNRDRLQKEYEKRNESLPLQEKIFSIRILSQIMTVEREEKLEKLEKLNLLLNPQNFLALKRELETKETYFKLLGTEKIEKEIEEKIIALQKIFLACYQSKIEKIDTKQNLMKLIYEFRYYGFIPFNQTNAINQIPEMGHEIEKVQRQLIKKAQELKLLESFSAVPETDYEILKNLFYVRIINLEDLYIRITKEKEKYFIQLFDEDVFEEKREIENIETVLKLNRKIKIFN